MTLAFACWLFFALFGAILQLPPDERAAFLASWDKAFGELK